LPDHYTRLLEWRREESAARGLHKLPVEFYPSTQAYLAETRATFESELRQNPSGKKGDLARQTHQRAAQIARDIVEARMMKILNLAFQASVGGGREIPNALPEERTLFDALTGTLRGHRTLVAPYLEPTAPAGGDAPKPAAAPVPPPIPTPPASTPRAATGLVTVRILKDSPPIEIGSGTVELRREDVLELPSGPAELLLKAHIAERVESAGAPVVT
jgi:DNA replication initiation complex subunit (GINS family)